MNLFNDFSNYTISRGILISTTVYPQKELIYLSKGYAIEFLEIFGQRNVISFIGPGELILQSTSYSTIEGITDTDVLTISRKNLFKMLRNFNECRQLYKIFKKKHMDKIAKYHNDLKNLTAGERYIELMETYPRVKEHAAQEDIASYLKISLADYIKMCTVE